MTVGELSAALIGRITGEAQALFGEVKVSLTGGEPLIHRDLAGIVAALRARAVPWTIVTNGWHMARALPILETHPPAAVRLSLSGANEAVHDAERGDGSFRRVLLAAAILTSRRIPFSLGILIDRRDRDDLREAADLAESLGAMSLQVLFAQPVPASAARGSDLTPHDWQQIVREVRALGMEPHRRTAVSLDFGAPPFPGEAPLTCDTFTHRRIYVNHNGELCLCCQLSEYGEIPTDVVADLNSVPLAVAYGAYTRQLAELRRAAEPEAGDVLAEFPCLRCARTSGKLDWLARYPESPWHDAPGVPAHA